MPLATGLYFPIETSSREFSGYLLTAVELAGSGVASILGHKGSVNAAMTRSVRPGVVFYKGLSPYYADERHYSVAQDPEAGISYLKYGDFFSLRSPGVPSAKSPAYFAFGPNDYEFLSGVWPDSRAIVPSGSPRVDLWRPTGQTFYAGEANAIRAHYGEPVLFASSGLTPHERYLAREREVGDYDEFMAHPFARAAIAAAQSLNTTVVVRPHPSESWKAWQAVATQADNLFVDTAFDLAAWSSAAPVVVHPGESTSAIEFALGGKPAISLGFHKGEIIGVPKAVSYRPKNLGETLETIEVARQGRLSALPNERARDLLRTKIFDETSAAAIICQELLRRFDFTGFPRHGLTRFSFSRKINRQSWTADASLGSKTEPPFKKASLPPEMVEAKIAIASQMLGLSRPPRLRPLADNCYLIAPA